ncbi:MAG: ATP synthase F0 subunit B [Proteobacteria bacterium]|nr:ATP synthase F0 subunit B [Pseudomonadota bacterium]
MRTKQLLKHLVLFAAFAFVFAGSPVMAEEAAKEAAGDQHASEEAGHHAEHLNWFDFTDEHSTPVVALLFNFICLLLIVYFILRKPLSQKFKDRKETLEKAINEANQMKARAEKALSQARSKMQAIDVEMARIRQEILDAGKAESARILEDAEAQAERMRSDAKAAVEQEIARLAQGIREQFADEVVAMAEQLVHKQIESVDHERLARDYLEGIGSSSAGSGR